MKNNSKILLLLSIVSLLCYTGYSAMNVFKALDSKRIYRHILLDGESISFGNELDMGKSVLVSKRGSYDGSAYRVDMINGDLKIDSIKSSTGLHQSELDLTNCYGTVSQNGDTTQFSATSVFGKFYIFNVIDDFSIDSFSQTIEVLTVTKSLEENRSSFVLSTNPWGVSGIAVPDGVKWKKIYKAEHSKKSVAVFDYLNVKDANGKTKSYPAADYVIVGADKLI